MSSIPHRSANDQLADEFCLHTVTLLRVAAGLCQPVFAILDQLQASLVAEIAAGAARPSPEGGRLNALLKQARANMRAAYKVACKTTEAALCKVAAVEQQKTASVVNKGAGATVMNAALNEEQLQKIASDTLLAGRFPWQWWLGQETALAGKFEATVRDGVAKHEGVDKLVLRVRGTKAANHADGIMSLARRNAETLVRALVHTVASQTRLLVCGQNAGPAGPVRAVTLRATLDPKSTTDRCQALNGLQWSLPGYEPVGHEQPFPGPFLHFGCRSTWLPVLDGPPAPTESAAQFLDRHDAELDTLLGPARAGAWRKGKLEPAEALSGQHQRPLSVAALQSNVDQGHSVPVPRWKEGAGGLSLAERRLLDKCHVAATQDGKVLAFFLNAHTGQSVDFEGTSPTLEAKEAAAGFGKLLYLRGATDNGAVFTPQEFALMASLPNFQGAKLANPDGGVLSMTVNKGETFTQADAGLINTTMLNLKNTVAFSQVTKLLAALGQIRRAKAVVGPKHVTSVSVREHGAGTIRPTPRRSLVVA